MRTREEIMNTDHCLVGMSQVVEVLLDIRHILIDGFFPMQYIPKPEGPYTPAERQRRMREMSGAEKLSSEPTSVELEYRDALRAMDEIERKNGDAPHRCVKLADRIRVACGDARTPKQEPIFISTEGFCISDPRPTPTPEKPEPNANRPWHEWRDAEKEKPEDGVDVWMFRPGYYIHKGFWNKDRACWFMSGDPKPFRFSITHWMPLPPGPWPAPEKPISFIKGHGPKSKHRLRK